MKILWISQHPFSAAQTNAISALHGADAQVEHRKLSFSDENGLAELITANGDAFVYAVGGAQHYLTAAVAGLSFGVFANHPAKRSDGGFGLAAVFHQSADGFVKVWENPDPNSDTGDVLMKPKTE